MDSCFNTLDQKLKDIRRLTAEFCLKPTEELFESLSGNIQDYIAMLKELDDVLEDALDKYLAIETTTETS